MPGGVKVARRPVKPFGVGASPTLAANLWKAGRYKLAAPVSKTGSESGAGSVTRAFRHLNHQTSGDQHDHSPIPSAMVAEQVAETCGVKTSDRKQKRPTGPADAYKYKAINPIRGW